MDSWPEPPTVHGRANRRPNAAQPTAWRRLWDHLLAPLPDEPQTQLDAARPPSEENSGSPDEEEAPN
jgi:hypothetical protein